MTNKHTPGPWSKEPGAGRGAWIYGANGEYVALSCGNDDAKAEANADVIMAAPEMLAALRECLSAEMSRREKLKPGAPASTYSDDRIARIQTAIAKAEGNLS